MQKISRDKKRLEDILAAIDEITSYANKEERDKKTERALAYLIAVIGEAVNHLSDELKEGNSEVPWQYIKGMRNRLIHEYANINVSMLWNVVDNEIPTLKKQIQDIFDKM